MCRKTYYTINLTNDDETVAYIDAYEFIHAGPPKFKDSYVAYYNVKNVIEKHFESIT